MNIQVAILPGEHSATPGRYWLKTDGLDASVAHKPAYAEALPGSIAVTNPLHIVFNDALGEVGVFNADRDTHVGPIDVEIVVGHLAKVHDLGQVRIWDGGFHGAIFGDRYGTVTPSPHADAVPLYDDLGGERMLPAPDTPATHHAGSARMHADVSAFVRRSMVSGGVDLKEVNRCLLENGQRPVHLWKPWGELHRASIDGGTPYGGYGEGGGWGSLIYGNDEHFGRPPGLVSSPWNPVDHLHLAAACWADLAFVSGLRLPAIHADSLIESMWIQFNAGTVTSPRAWGPLFGAIASRIAAGSGDGVAEHYRSHVLPDLLNQLQHHQFESLDRWGNHEWAPVVGNHEDRADHLQQGICSWMLGQLVLGLGRLAELGAHLLGDDNMTTVGALLMDQRAGAIRNLVRDTWGNGQQGWYGDARPDGATLSGGKHSLTGVFRQWILPALEVAMEHLSSLGYDGKGSGLYHDLAREAHARSCWLAFTLAKGGWFGSSMQADRGWGTFLLDEGWRICKRLNAWNKDSLQLAVLDLAGDE